MSPVRLHVGVYAYRPEALELYVATPVSELETLEGLEQLRFLAPACRSRSSMWKPRPSRCANSTIRKMSSRSSRHSRRPGSSELSRLARSSYRLILCDIWGVVHDGVTLYPGAAERLGQWRREGRCVALITNAPRTAEAVEPSSPGSALPRDAYDFVATSGEAGIEALLGARPPVGFIGTQGDRAILEGRGVRIADDEDFTTSPAPA